MQVLERKGEMQSNDHRVTSAHKLRNLSLLFHLTLRRLLVMLQHKSLQDHALTQGTEWEIARKQTNKQKNHPPTVLISSLCLVRSIWLKGVRGNLHVRVMCSWRELTLPARDISLLKIHG